MAKKTIVCPYCNADVEVDTQGRESVFCNYCGKLMSLLDEKESVNINKNINVNKDIKIHKRTTNDADVIRAQTEAKKTKHDLITFAAIMSAFLLIVALSLGIPAITKAINRNEGKVTAGYYKDLIGEDYKTVQAHFEAAGFTNIELIDLDDAGLTIWKDGKVKTISIGGDTSFDSDDWFDPDTKVVISHH